MQPIDLTACTGGERRLSAMPRRGCVGALGVVWLLSATLFSGGVEAQDLEPVLLARSSPTDGFRLPADTGFANNTVALNNNGEVSLNIGSLPPNGERGIWVGDADAGGVVVTGDPDWIFSDTAINDDGVIVWPRSFSPADGIYQYDPLSGMDQLLTTEPFGASSWGSVGIDSDGAIGYRASFTNGQVWTSLDAAGSAAMHAVETGLDASSRFAFLFTPAFNNQRQIAGKVRLDGLDNNQPDQIIRTEAGQITTVLVEDADSLPGSPFADFNNSIGFNDNGDVAFVTLLVSPAVRALYRTVDGQPEELAREGQGEISELEFFAPRMNNNGQVVFRAIDTTGRRAIWMSDGNSVQRLIGQDDLVTTDVGQARIASPTGGPVFSAGIDLNQRGEVAFVAVLTDPKDTSQLVGLGIFLLALPDGVIFADGFEAS